MSVGSSWRTKALLTESRRESQRRREIWKTELRLALHLLVFSFLLRLGVKESFWASGEGALGRLVLELLGLNPYNRVFLA